MSFIRKYKDKHLSALDKLDRLTQVLVFAFLVLVPVATPAQAAGGFPSKVRIAAGEQIHNRQLNVGIGRSVVIDLGDAVADVLVSNPKIADAIVKTQNRVLVLGNEAGQASLVLFASNGRELGSFRLRVEPDISDLTALIRRLLPKTNIKAEVVNGNIILTGTAQSTAEAQRAADIATRFSGEDSAPILNMVAVDGKDQVHLKVTVAEVNRSVVKQLGLQFSGSVGFGNFTARFNNPTSFTANPNVFSQSLLGGVLQYGRASVSADLRALQRDGVVRTLAEPTLTAISGESASFLSGGEFPIPVSEENNRITVAFKKFGVGLDFTPVVLSGGRINLRIKTEVSELTSEGAVNTGGITISGIKVRRAESTLELPSGGTLVMAGLLKENYTQTVNGVPGLMQLPILGSLFKSRDFLKKQTELVIFVTPYVVSPVAPGQMTRPDKNLVPPSDAETIFLNRLNKIFSRSQKNSLDGYHGQVGFIYK